KRGRSAVDNGLIDLAERGLAQMGNELGNVEPLAPRLHVGDRRAQERGLCLAGKMTTLDVLFPRFNNSFCNLCPRRACASVNRDAEVGAATVVVRPALARRDELNWHLTISRLKLRIRSISASVNILRLPMM